MGSIADKLNFTRLSVDDIEKALSEKGFDMTLYDISHYGDLIRKLSGSGGPIKPSDEFIGSMSVVVLTIRAPSIEIVNVKYQKPFDLSCTIKSNNITTYKQFKLRDTIFDKNILIENSQIDPLKLKIRTLKVPEPNIENINVKYTKYSDINYMDLENASVKNIILKNMIIEDTNVKNTNIKIDFANKQNKLKTIDNNSIKMCSLKQIEMEDF